MFNVKLYRFEYYLKLKNMCGFFYFCCWEDLKEDPLIKVKSEIKKALIERGGENYNETTKSDEGKYVFTAHALLPIFGDLETNYPIESENSSLLFNGQIYGIKNQLIKDSNYKNDGFALKDYLDLDGKNSFNSILNIPNDLSGQFSFVYINKYSKIILLAHDLAGQKPIYFLKTKKILIVSSILEILSLFTSSNKDRMYPNKLFSLPYKFSDIEKIPPGGVVKFDLDNGKLLLSKSIYSYFRLFMQSLCFEKKELLLKEEFFLSINEIIPKNKNFVLSLSGGYDSTNIALGIKLLGYKPTNVFTIQNDNNSLDVKVAQEICEQFNWSHTLIKPLKKLNGIDYSSIPNDPAALSIASIAKNAISYSNVILCGDGGDEISRRYIRFLYYRFPLNILKLIKSLKFISLMDLLIT